jgi:Leucine-rich repeat (LRR) protein
LGNLEHLQQLFLASNRLNGTIPVALSKLGRLAHLSLQNNALEGSIPSDLGALSKLKSLHLDHNHLTGTIPSSLGTLSLSDLTASSNLLTGILPSSLADIARKGRVVDFSYNRLHGDIPVELCLARNMFLIANNVTNRCNEICRDKRYRVCRMLVE